MLSCAHLSFILDCDKIFILIGEFVKNLKKNLHAQEICTQVNKFLKGTSSPNGNVNFESLSSSALFLLRTVPVARHAVLEHYSLLFDDAINSSLNFSDRVPHGEQSISMKQR